MSRGVIAHARTDVNGVDLMDEMLIFSTKKKWTRCSYRCYSYFAVTIFVVSHIYAYYCATIFLTRDEIRVHTC